MPLIATDPVAPICLLCGYIMDMIGEERTAEAARAYGRSQTAQDASAKAEISRAIEYECTRKRKQREHYVKKDKYFYKKNDIFEITSDVKDRGRVPV